LFSVSSAPNGDFDFFFVVVVDCCVVWYSDFGSDALLTAAKKDMLSSACTAVSDRDILR